jgi:hypothetical protein
MGASAGGWPFLEAQCLHCRYFYAYEPARTDDKGYALPGFCRHPRIAMELFVTETRPDLSAGSCSLFVGERYARGRR